MEYEEIVTAIMGRRRFGKACGRQVAEELLARLNCPERGCASFILREPTVRDPRQPL